MTEPYDTLPCDVEPPSDRRKNHDLRKLIKIGDAMAKSLMNCMGVTARGVWEEWTVLVPKMRQPAYKPDGMLRKPSDDLITVQVGPPERIATYSMTPPAEGEALYACKHRTLGVCEVCRAESRKTRPIRVRRTTPFRNSAGVDIPGGTYTPQELENYEEGMKRCERCGLLGRGTDLSCLYCTGQLKRRE